MDSTAVAPLTYSDFVSRYRLRLLMEKADLSVGADGLRMTKDFDLMVGDVAYSALFRLVNLWRCNAKHLELLYSQIWEMASERHQVDERLNHAAEIHMEQAVRTGKIGYTSEFLAAWHEHWEEESTAQMGEVTYAGCVLILASSAISRFRNDLDVPNSDWNGQGLLFGGQSVGQIIVAGANAFRHADEWAKSASPSRQQKASQSVLAAALGRGRLGDPDRSNLYSAVLELLSRETGFDGFTHSVMHFAHELALKRRAAGESD